MTKWPKLTSLWLLCSVLRRDSKNELDHLNLINLLVSKVVFHSVCSARSATNTLVSRNRVTFSWSYQKYNSIFWASLSGWQSDRLRPALCRAFRFNENTKGYFLFKNSGRSRTFQWVSEIGFDVQTQAFQFLGITGRASQ